MRPIKFRAWSPLAREMYKVNSLHFDKEGLSEIVVEVFEVDGVIYSSAVARNLELMQFTGLQDKNGKDIYEGDICKIEDGMVYSSVAHRMIEGHYQVYWNTDRWGLQISQFEDYDNGDYYHGSEITWQECEIIGNIYEHPELMREQAQ